VRGEVGEVPPREDHRIRVAREKRERMRELLFQSVLAVYPGREGNSGGAVIDDVVLHAGVSRGTFYKYFNSLDQAVAELALRLADEMASSIASIHDVLEEPVMRTSTGFLTFLARALIDPDWGAFIMHIGLLSEENALLSSKIKSDIRQGIEAGDYVLRSVEAAADLLMGAKIQAIRRIVDGERKVANILMTAELVLRAFGVAPEVAESSVMRAFERMRSEAPGRLAWWRPLDEAGGLDQVAIGRSESGSG
jgi:AcrR family transcriptional regulator